MNFDQFMNEFYPDEGKHKFSIEDMRIAWREARAELEEMYPPKPVKLDTHYSIPPRPLPTYIDDDGIIRFGERPQPRTER